MCVGGGGLFVWMDGWREEWKGGDKGRGKKDDESEGGEMEKDGEVKA